MASTDGRKLTDREAMETGRTQSSLTVAADLIPRQEANANHQPEFGAAPRPAPQVEIVIPVRNEEKDLARCVHQLADYLSNQFPFSYRITIADNGSTDGTWSVAATLCQEYANVRATHLDQSGRGRALRSVWLASDAEVLAYTDVDLSIGLNGLLPLVSPLISGHSDLAIGTRLARGARQVRTVRREVLSRGYNLLLHLILGTEVSDAQCGFKAIRADKARDLLPLTRDASWFFDTEMLVIAERSGLRIYEVPVDCVDDPNSSVSLVPTALADLRGIMRMRFGSGRDTAVYRSAFQTSSVSAPRLTGQLARFACIGVVSTVAYVFLYLLLRRVTTSEAANAVSLFVTAMANTAINRRITFGIRGSTHATRHQVQGLMAFVAGLLVTSAALAIFNALSPKHSHLSEAVVLVGAGLIATGLRFALYRWWVFRPRQAPPAVLH